LIGRRATADIDALHALGVPFQALGILAMLTKSQLPLVNGTRIDLLADDLVLSEQAADTFDLGEFVMAGRASE
jgi:hypothetical protein